MSTNTKQNAIGPRLLAGTSLGVALVLMVVAGMYSRADSSGAQVAVRAVDSNEPMRSNFSADLPGAAQKKEKPSLPPQEPQPPQPAQPSHPAQATQPTQPAQASQPSHPAQASQPDQPPPPPPRSSMRAPSAPPPPPPRTADDQDKSSSKAEKEESGQKQGKREVVKGELIEAPRPIYPEEAKKRKIEGTVAVDIVIGHEGNVIYARAASGPELLQDAARDAAFKARFKPTMLNGRAVKITAVITYDFALDEK